LANPAHIMLIMSNSGLLDFTRTEVQEYNIFRRDK